MDLSKLTTADKVVSISAIVLLIGSFLPWFTVSVEGDDFFQGAVADGNGWDVGFLWSGVPVILGILMVVQIALSRFSPDTQLPELPWSKVHLGLGIAAAVLVLLKLLIGEDDGGFDFVEVSRAWGLFVSAIAAVGLAVGGYLKFQEGEDSAAAAGPPQSF